VAEVTASKKRHARVADTLSTPTMAGASRTAWGANHGVHSPTLNRVAPTTPTRASMKWPSRSSSKTQRRGVVLSTCSSLAIATRSSVC
ncbi:unnamed protein product, partial [Aphanomyces euteiches]